MYGTKTAELAICFGKHFSNVYILNKKQVGSCFVVDCCEWNERQNDDICGLDNSRISTYDKMNRILNHSVLKSAFEEAGL